MIVLSVSIALFATSPATQLVDACVEEGTSKTECVCYAGFIKKNATKRELTALATLAEPQNRASMEKAFTALMDAGLTPSEIFNIGVRVEELTGEATKTCKGKKE